MDLKRFVVCYYPIYVAGKIKSSARDRKNMRLAGFLIFAVFIFLTAPAIAQTSNSPAKTSRSVKAKKVSKSKPKMNQKFRPVEPSEWGAAGIGLVVEKALVKIEYDCAKGEINQPLTIGGDGSFKVTGSHTRLSPGPIRLSFPPKPKPAIYEGKITGKTMTLKVTLTETKEVIGEFTLERDKSPGIRRCL